MIRKAPDAAEQHKWQNIHSVIQALGAKGLSSDKEGEDPATHMQILRAHILP
jgi:hypothetical protein